MDISQQSRLLLEMIANSVYDRDKGTSLFFTSKEKELVEDFLKGFRATTNSEQHRIKNIYKNNPNIKL